MGQRCYAPSWYKSPPPPTASNQAGFLDRKGGEMEVKYRGHVVDAETKTGVIGSQPSEERTRRKCNRLCNCKMLLLMVLGLCIFVWAYPSPIDPIAYKYSDSPCPSLEGPLAVNDLLAKAERILENKVIGPEAVITDDKGHIYTGLADGRIIRISEDLQSYEVIIRTGESQEACDSGDIYAILKSSCGRPLGMAFRHSNHDELYVADGSYGFLKVNVKTKEKEVLWNADTPSSSVPIKFPNDLVELSNGTVLITDSSSKFTRLQSRLEALEGRGNGQLLAYDPVDGSIRVVLRELFFPNGICLHHDGESVLISETTRARIKRFYFTGSKEGKLEDFVTNLPVLPDNLSSSRSGGYWVGCALLRSPSMDALTDNLFVRSFMAKFGLDSYLEMVVPAHGLALELDEEGHVVRSLHDQGGLVTFATSQILETEDGELFVGSYFAPYLIRLKL